MCAWLEVYLTPIRYELEGNSLDYQPLLEKGAGPNRKDSKEWRKPSLKLEKLLIIIILSAH